MNKKKQRRKIISLSGEQSSSFSYSGKNTARISYTNSYLDNIKICSLSGNRSYNGYAYSFSGR